MSKIASYREKEELLRKLTDEMNKLKEDPALKKELDFKEEINQVLNKYSLTLNDLAKIFQLDGAKSSGKGRGNRQVRKLKVYVNPNNGETVETRGGNHKVLKAWKAQYGNDTVESWLKEER